MKTLATTLAAALLISGGYAVSIQTHNQMPHHSKVASGKGTMAMCKRMMAEKHQFMMQMKDMDTKMTSMVAAMDVATGDAKIAAMSDLLKTMVAQRAKMRSMMDSMDSKMMGHMMMHMKSGGMMKCPMMKDMMNGGMMKGMMGK